MFCRFRFTILGLCLLTTMIAACLAIVLNVDSLSVVGICAGLFVLGVAKKTVLGSQLFRVGLLVLGSALLWLSVIDRSAVLDKCSHCLATRTTISIRVLGLPVHSTVSWERSDLIFAEIASDLGRPCVHEFEERQLYRDWGFVHRSHSNNGGTIGFSDTLDYDNQMRLKVLKLKQADPELANKFYQKVLVDGDQAFTKEFLDAIITNVPQH